MDVNEKEEIKREFQLERMILFSDAVFAIIITIMVLEIKLPEGLRHASSEAVREAFLEVLPKFGGYAVSFTIVSIFWSKHLELFSYLKDYTKKLIAFNMVFLFFISLFPFSISLLTGAISVGNPYGLVFYFFVILMALFTQTLLVGYMVRNAQALCIKPAEIERNLQWRAQRFNLFTIPILFAYVLIGFFAGISPIMFSYGIIAWALSQAVIRKKLYPNEPNQGKPFLARLFKSRKKKLSP